MSDRDMKSLELRLERIEKAIDSLGSPGRREAKLSEDDVAAYHRVREALWEEGTCGINETSPCVFSCHIVDKICKVVPVCKVCIFECTCGPCNQFTDLGDIIGGLGRFRTLGR